LDGLAGIPLVSQAEISHNSVTSNTSFQCSQQLLGGIMRYELRKMMMPILEENFAKSESRNEALLREMKNIIERSASDLSRNFMSIDNDNQMGTETSSQLPGAVPNNQPPDLSSFNEALHRQQVADVLQDLTKPATNQERYRQEASSTNTKSRRIWSHWSSASWIGTVRIEVRSTTRVGKANSTQQRTFELSIFFWPSRYIPWRRSISLFYTNRANECGYFQICPMIATFPIVARTAPSWQCVRVGNLNGLHSLFVNGLASPKDQDDKGTTLLHVRSVQASHPFIVSRMKVSNLSAV
jgi:hypothetical protein